MINQDPKLEELAKSAKYGHMLGISDVLVTENEDIFEEGIALAQLAKEKPIQKIKYMTRSGHWKIFYIIGTMEEVSLLLQEN